MLSVHIDCKYAARWPPSTHTVRQVLCGQNNPNFSHHILAKPMPTPPFNIYFCSYIMLTVFIYMAASELQQTAMLTSSLWHLGANSSWTEGTYTSGRVWFIPSMRCNSTSKIYTRTKLFHLTFMALLAGDVEVNPGPQPPVTATQAIPPPQGPLLSQPPTPNIPYWPQRATPRHHQRSSGNSNRAAPRA